MELKLRMIDCVYFCCRLLIVPYGIETVRIADNTAIVISFNRTLWN